MPIATIETTPMENMALYKEIIYSPTTRTALLETFEALVKRGVILSHFEDPAWKCSNGVRSTSIDFTLSGISRRCSELLRLSVDEAVDCLKCFTLLIMDEFIFTTICLKIRGILTFLSTFGDDSLSLAINCKSAVLEYLTFISVPQSQILAVEQQIFGLIRPRSGPRTLCHFVNYLVLDNELTELYDNGTLDRDTFIRWFPVLFWDKITLVLPLRATETLVISFNCITRSNGKIQLQVRRTLLKGYSKRSVQHTVEGDYQLFQYTIPDLPIVRHIEQYQAYTGHHRRRFLFDYNDSATNMLCSLASFERLLKKFWEQHIAQNPRYDFIRSTLPPEKFRAVRVGDSRHIALCNLYSQGIDLDICRQLAGQHDLDITYHYARSALEVAEATSTLQMQHRLNSEEANLAHDADQNLRNILRESSSPGQQAHADIPGVTVSFTLNTPEVPRAPTPIVIEGMEPWRTGAVCSSPDSPWKTGNIEECRRTGHLFECFGCRYYVPDEAELERVFAVRRQALDDAVKTILETVSDLPAPNDQLDQRFQDLYSSYTRYSTACNMKAERQASVWRRYHPLEQTVVSSDMADTP